MAFQRTGGGKNLRKSTAELLAKMEKKIREERQRKWRRKNTEISLALRMDMLCGHSNGFGLR